jgi:hypothetical protein
VYLGKAVQTVNPPNSSVGSSQVSADLITGQTALTSEPATTDELLISDAGTLKRIDYSLISNRPAFEAINSAHQSVNDITNTRVQFDTEIFDTDNCFDNSTNYRFTPTTAGKYFVYLRTTIDAAAGELRNATCRIYKNGTSIAIGKVNFHESTSSTTDGEGATPVCTAIVDMNGSSDYLEGFAEADTNTGGTCNVQGHGTERTSHFGAFKLTGI